MRDAHLLGGDGCVGLVFPEERESADLIGGRRGARFRVYDPVAAGNARMHLSEWSGSIEYMEENYEALEGADALLRRPGRRSSGGRISRG